MSSGQVEKYQLKWHSHNANLNSSVATLFRNEKFADVILMTSNASEPAAIPAHKVILSTCSHFFSSMFESSPSTTGASVVYVILPPELTKRSLEILIQYMYCGEATVPNDVLNEVLKGGEILKVRGLWRNGSNDYIDHLYDAGNYSHLSNPVGLQTASSGRSKLIPNSYELLKDRQVGIRNPVPGRSCSNDCSEDCSKSTPPPPLPSSLIGASASANLNRPYYPTTSTVYVKKDMGRDPGTSSSCETCMITTTTARRSYHSNEAINEPISHLPTPPRPTIRPPLAENQNYINSPSPGSSYRRGGSHSQASKCVKSYYNQKPGEGNEQRPFNYHESERRPIIHLNKPRTPNTNDNPFIGGEPANVTGLVTDDGNIQRSRIKQEPREWQDDEFEEKPQPIPRMEVSVKTEVLYNEETDGGGSGGEDVSSNPMYTPLTCELCKETFTVPGDWVKHIENHAETPQTVPKKRRRTEEINNESMASLKCDLCSMYLTPAEWVRHIQNSHTENELALSNTLAKSSSFNNGDPLLENTLDQNCAVCTKSSFSASPIHNSVVECLGKGGVL